MKVKGIICDVCGDSVYKHARYQYRLKKRFWETEIGWKRMDLCEECYSKMTRWIIKERVNETDN